MTYGLVAIVKDEEAIIDRFLASAARVASIATIVDTGSTDATMERIRAHPMEGRLVQFPFAGMGPSRTCAFTEARGAADWLLALDADMTVEIDPDFVPDPAVDAYMVRLQQPDFEWRLPLLLRGDLPWVSIGAYHEFTCLADGSTGRRENTDKVHVTIHEGKPWTPEKGRWIARLLEDDLRREPGNARTIFYLAQTRKQLGERDVARELYRRRAAMDGWEEERFCAAWEAAVLEPEWPARAAGLLEAWEMRPTRIEPLYDLCRELNSRGAHQSVWRLSLPWPAPTTDSLFVHSGVWDWGMAFERSIAAWWVGQREEFAALTSWLLDKPDLPAVIRAQVERNAAMEMAA